MEIASKFRSLCVTFVRGFNLFAWSSPFNWDSSIQEKELRYTVIMASILSKIKKLLMRQRSFCVCCELTKF